ncbi:hypothetical protein TNCV_2592511 [Trichonephila clavipes]|nr:hypothetical protein TNCV_2592511 [Trichonephila clavipes]
MILSVKQLQTRKNITVMGHPPYSPDLAPSDFFCFLQLNLVKREPILPRGVPGKNRESPEKPSKNFVPEVFPAMRAPNAELCEC